MFRSRVVPCLSVVADGMKAAHGFRLLGSWGRILGTTLLRPRSEPPRVAALLQLRGVDA
jgi:hypothetical protein